MLSIYVFLIIVTLTIVIVFYKIHRIRKIWKRINKTSLLISGILIVFLLFVNYEHNGNDFSEIKKTFFEHGWIELASGILLYLLLEIKITDYGDVPSEDGNRDYNEILNGIKDSKSTVRVLDNDFSTFFEDESSKKKQKINEANLIKCFEACLEKLGNRQKIEILLLHPNTPAAKQRYDDLQIHDFDFFERMNTGLQFLYDFQESLKDKRNSKGEKLSDKIEVKLFKTSYSIVFVSWADNINFSVLPPKISTDFATFKTLLHTPLAKYFTDNFNAIWNQQNKTVSLEQYKGVTIKDLANNTIIRSVPWGADSNNHDLPIFICISENSKAAFDDAIKGENEQKNKVQIIHDNEMQWAEIEEIQEKNEEHETENLLTIYGFAKDQIHKKSKFPATKQFIYKIEYTNRHKIVLQEDDYVEKYLNRRGYCYTPHTKYEIFLGLHMKRMLSALFDFYITKFEDFLDKENADKPYRRILAQYECIVGNNGEVVIKNENVSSIFGERFVTENGTSYIKRFSQINFKTLIEQKKVEIQSIPETTSKEKIESEIELYKEMNAFLKTTIDADISRILGQRNKLDKQGNFKKEEDKYKVVVHMIRAKVSLTESVPNRSKIDGYPENRGLYTVLHFVGKKNILGGIPGIYKKGATKPVKNYNLNSTLDSIYIKNREKLENQYKIEIDSSETRFSPEEAARRNKRNPKDDNQFGYRNVLAIEFFENDPKWFV